MTAGRRITLGGLRIIQSLFTRGGGNDGQSEIDQEEDKQRCSEAERQVCTEREGSTEEEGSSREGSEREASSGKSCFESGETESATTESGAGESGTLQAKQNRGNATAGRGKLDRRDQGRARSTSSTARLSGRRIKQLEAR
jgi:hypothetical protein